jgi:hypothetical protein
VAGIMLPLALALTLPLVLAAIDVVVDIGIPVDVDIHITATPVGATPCVSPCSTDGYTASKSKACAPRVSRVGI